MNCPCNLVPPRGEHAESCENYTHKNSLIERIEGMKVRPIDYSLPENQYAEQGKDTVGYNRALDDVLKIVREI